MSVIDSLLTELGFEYDPKDLEDFNKGVESSVNVARKMLTVISSVSAALFGFSVATTKAVDEQGKLSNETGVSVETISALEFAIQRAGGEASGLSNSLRQLSIRASEAARGVGSGVEAFGLLGITVTDVNGDLKSTDQLLLEVSDRLEGLDNARQIELADKLGMTDAIRLIQLGDDGIEDLIARARELGVTTRQDAAISEEFQDSLVDFWTIVKDISRAISRELTPAFREGIDMFSDWWRLNRTLILQNLPGFVDKVVEAISLLTKIAGAFLALKLFKVIGQGVILFNKLKLGVGGFAAILGGIPALIGAAVAGVALLAEDAKVFLQGGDSAFGRLIDRFPAWKRELEIIAGIFATIASATEMIVDGWTKIFDVLFSDSNTTFQEHLDILKTIGGDLLTGASRFFGFEGSAAPGATNNSNVANTTRIDKLEVNVNDQGSPEAVGKAVLREFQQASQDVNSAVYQ